MFSAPPVGGTPASQDSGVEFTHAEEALTSRLVQWSSAFRLGRAGPRAVESRPESIGAIHRNEAGAAEQGDATREAIRGQSARLIEQTPRFEHEATGAVIEDAHTDNVFHDDNGDLYPFDVVVEVLLGRPTPSALACWRSRQAAHGRRTALQHRSPVYQRGGPGPESRPPARPSRIQPRHAPIRGHEGP